MDRHVAILELLAEDLILNSVFELYHHRIWLEELAGDPVPDRHFLILKWTDGGRQPAAEVLTVCAHVARQQSKDYLPLDALLERVRTVLTTARTVRAQHVETSGELTDEVLGTITKHSTFRVLGPAGR